MQLQFLRRNELYRNFLGASTVSLLGSNLFDIAIPLYVLERTHSALALSWTGLALNLPYFLMAPITGFLVDHFDKRKVMIAADIGQLTSLFILFLYDFLPSDSIWPVLALVFSAKSLMILFETVATFQLIPALVSRADLSEANQWFLSSQRLIQILGPLAGGALLGTLGIRACIIANMLSFVATLRFNLRIPSLGRLIDGAHTPGTHSMTVGRVIDDFIQSIAYVWRSPLFRPFICLMFLGNLTSMGLNTPSMTYYYTELKSFSAARYGAAISLFGVVGIIGYLVADIVYRQLKFANTVVSACYWQAITGTLALCLFPFPMAFTMAFALSRFGASILNMGTFILRQTEIPRERMGGVNSCMRMFFMSAAPISALVQGILIHHVGVFLSFFLGAGCLWGTVWFAKRIGMAYAYKEQTAAHHVDPPRKEGSA